jgi:hypothetical protein
MHIVRPQIVCMSEEDNCARYSDGLRLSAMRESVALIPQCVECEDRWLPADENRWSAYLTDDEPSELAFFCPECGVREFSTD